MNRRSALFAVVVCLPNVGTDEPPKVSEYISDPRYVPADGDRVHLFAVAKDGSEFGAWCAAYASDYRDFGKALGIRDDDGIAEMLKKGDVVRVPARTPILVVTAKCQSPEGASEVRIMDGPHKGGKFYTPSYYVARIVKKSDLPKGKTKKRR